MAISDDNPSPLRTIWDLLEQAFRGFAPGPFPLRLPKQLVQSTWHHRI